jgi:ABC-2 type transport system permease protein
MPRVFAILRHEVFVTIRRKGYLFMTLGIPIIASVGVLAFVILQGEEDDAPYQNPLDHAPNRPIGYVDYSGTFDDSGDLAPAIVRFPTEDAARNALQKGELISYYVIAADYMATGNLTRKAPQLDFMASDTDVFRAFLIKELLGDEDPDLLLRLYQPARMIEHQLDASGAELSQVDEEQRYGGNFVLVYGFAMILILSTMIPAGYLLRSVVEEKENRTIEIVLSSTRPLEMLTGKVLGLGGMGLLQIIIWLATGWVLFKFAAGDITTLQSVDLSFGKIAIVLIYFLGGFLLIASIQAGLGAVSTNMREGPQYATFFTLPMVIPLWLLSIFVEAPNGTLAVILSIFPITAPLAMVQRVAITVVPIWQLALSISLLALGIVITLWLAAKVFRMHILLAGSLPKPSELLRAVRES